MSKQIISKLKKTDPKLSILMKKAGPFTVGPNPKETIFQAIARSIIYQQLAGKAAASILNKVKLLYPRKKFPTPEDILATPFETLRSAGVSNAKATALKDLALKCVNNEIPTRKQAEKMSDDEIIESLIKIRGVGRWTAQMFLMFNLGRLDVLPDGDYGVRKGFSLVYRKKDLPTPKQLLAFGEKWKPYRSVASWYMWRALELPEYTGKIIKA